jgi:hypothetical protein
VTDFDRLGNALSESASTEESSSKSVTGTVGVDDSVLGESLDGVSFGRGRIGSSDDGRGGTLGNDDDTGSVVRLGRGSEFLGDLGDVLGLYARWRISL